MRKKPLGCQVSVKSRIENAVAAEGGAQCRDCSVVEVRADGGEPAAVEGVFKAGGNERAGLSLAGSEEPAGHERECYGERVVEEDVEEGEEDERAIPA